MLDLYHTLWPALRRLRPETAHNLAFRALKLGLVPTAKGGNDDPVLAVRLWGLDFDNPIGLAAGFDKEAAAIPEMFGLGFGFVEPGTVTPLPQPGNPKPRLFRLDEDNAAINRLGFNSGGLADFAGNLAKYRRKRTGGGPVGANIGRNKNTEDDGADFEIGIEALAPLVDYLVINVSSPNTPGLRTLQRREALEDLIGRGLTARARAVTDAASRPPLLVKIAPDLDAAKRRDIAELALAMRLDGLIAGNTTVARPAELRAPDKDEAGGLSGRPLFAPSTAFLADMYRLTGGRIPLIGCGGVASGAAAYAKLRAGAALVQLYTALVFEGPDLIPRIKRDLAKLLRDDGFGSVAEAVGVDVVDRPSARSQPNVVPISSPLSAANSPAATFLPPSGRARATRT